MVIFSRLLIAGLVAAGLGGAANAQVVPAGLSQAQARLACGTGIVLGAVTLPNGAIEVTCEAQAAGSGVPTALAGALTPEIAAGIAAALVFVAVVAGDGGSSSTTTEALSPILGE